MFLKWGTTHMKKQSSENDKGKSSIGSGCPFNIGRMKHAMYEDKKKSEMIRKVRARKGEKKYST